MKTLYISDLDGTLLDSNACISEYTKNKLNKLINEGMHFSFATARTIASAKKIMADVDINVPVVLMNWVLIYDLSEKRYVKIEVLKEEHIIEILKIAKSFNSTGFLYQIKDDELHTYYENLEQKAHFDFYNERVTKYYKSFEKVSNFLDMDFENTIYFAMIDKKENLQGIYDALISVSGLEMTFYKDIYSENLWYLEIFSSNASKYKAVQFIKEKFKFDKMVCFGDNLNDLPLFKACDEKYAVGNARDEVKLAATEVIEENINDGVAKWLEQNVEKNNKLKAFE